MKQILKISAVLILFILLLESCNKKWLVPEPLSSLTPENSYIDKSGFEALLITMRKNLKAEAYGNNNFFAQEMAASDLGVPQAQLDFTHKLTPSSDRYWQFLSMFTKVYEYIKDCNVCISRIGDIKWDDERDKNSILAEAYWHRAYWYYRLINSYGDVPWSGEEVLGAKLDYNTYSRWTILNKLQLDMEFAVQWLPESSPSGVVSKGAGNMLLTKIYLANLNFDKAIETSTRVINGSYSLMTKRFGTYSGDTKYNIIWDLHRPENMNAPQNTEKILATVDRFEAPSDAKSIGLYSMRNYNPAFYLSRVTDSKGSPGTVAAGPEYDSLGRGNPNVRPSPFYEYDLWAFGNYNWMNTPDLRRSDVNWWDADELLYNNPSSVDYGKPINPQWFTNMADTLGSYFATPFYVTYVKQEDPKAVPMGGNGDWYIYRLAETYLLRAEAYFWKNEPGLAANDINMVRQRAGALPISGGDVNIDFIFDERARELFAESPRHSELVRVSYIMAKLNKEGYSLANFSSKNYYHDRVMMYNILYHQPITKFNNEISLSPFNILWPIPSNVITANTLGVINQNVGYDGADKNIPPIETPIN